MSDLIHELRQEHLALLEAIGQVQKQGVGSPQGRARLADTKKMLLDHLGREDDELYPALRAAAKQNERLNLLLKTFTDEMRDIAQAATEFFAAHDGEKPSPRFALELGSLLGVLRARINKEESQLYPEYGKLG